MILRKVENIIKRKKKEGEFIYPFYENYCFSNIPPTILSFFNIKTKRPILPTELYSNIGKPKKEFFDRIGDILILPYKHNTIWYEHIKGKKLEFLGHHGGLSEEEMLIPFAIAKLSDLKI